MKVAIYCRLSEEDRNKVSKEDESNSIKNQKAMLVQYARSQDWDIYEIYSDDDFAGSDRNRPQFRRLLDDAQSHRFEIVLCTTQSRFTRELELVEKYIHGLFPIWGIRFVSIIDHADSANKGNKKSRQINGLINEWYLEDMSENIRSVLNSRRMNGFHIGAFAPYGYKKDPDKKGHLIIDEEAAEIVREIFTMFADGYGKTAIARILNDRGIPNPTEYKRQKGLRYKQPPSTTSMLWKYTSVAEILTNEVYIGNLVQGKYESISYKTRKNRPCPKERWIRVEGTHKAVVEMSLWNRVQNKVKSHARPNRYTGMVHIFSGVAFCMYCGYALRVHKGHGHYYLQCETKQISDEACPGAFIPEAELEQIVIAELNKFNENLLDREKLQREIQCKAVISSQKAKLLSMQKGYQKKADEYAFSMKQLYVDKVNGLIAPGDYFSMSESFRQDKERFDAMVRSCQKRIDDIDTRIYEADLLSQYVDLGQLTRTIVEILINRIKIGKRNKVTKQVPVTIYWNI